MDIDEEDGVVDIDEEDDDTGDTEDTDEEDDEDELFSGACVRSDTFISFCSSSLFSFILIDLSFSLSLPSALSLALSSPLFLSQGVMGAACPQQGGERSRAELGARPRIISQMRSTSSGRKGSLYFLTMLRNISIPRTS